MDSIRHSVIGGFDNDSDHVGVKIETNDLCFNLVSLYTPSNTLKLKTIEKYSELGPDLFLLGDLNAKTKQTLGCKTLDSNERVLEAILASELDLCVLNDRFPTYFKHKSDYSELLDLFIYAQQF